MIQQNNTINLNYNSEYTLSCGSVNSRPKANVDIINGSNGQSLTLNPNVYSVNTISQCDPISAYCTSVFSISISLNNTNTLLNSLICASQNTTVPYNFNAQSSKFKVNILGAPSTIS